MFVTPYNIYYQQGRAFKEMKSETNEEQIKNKKRKTPDATMSFLDHLDELRTRLIRFAIVLTVCVLAAYFYRKELLDLIRKPVEVPLKKYTAVAPAPTSPLKSGLSSLGAYNCVCREGAPVSDGTEAVALSSQKPASELPDSAMSEPTGDTPSLPAENLEQVGNVLQKIGASLDDFIMFFQVMLNKEPSPVFTDRAPLKTAESQALKTAVPLPGTLNLNCQCSVSQPAPATGSTMVYIGLPELFFAQMKVAIFAGFFIAFPYMLIELWGFVGPALYGGEKKIYWIFSTFTYLFFIGGALFGYFVVFPFAFEFFLSLAQPGEIMPSLSIGDFLSLAIKMLLAFGFIFEMPLATFILARLGVLTPGIMIRQARVAILVVFVLSAVLTPPDPFTMMLMAGPLIILYLISIGVCFLGLNRQKAAQRAQGIELDD